MSAEKSADQTPALNNKSDLLVEQTSKLVNYPMDLLKLFVWTVRSLIGLLGQLPEINVTSTITEVRLSDYLKHVVRALRNSLVQARPEEWKKKIRIRAKEATLLDKVYFRTFFNGQPGLAGELLQAITGKKDIQITRLETEVDYNRADGNKGAVMDLVCWDTESAAYDTEAQGVSANAPIGRAVHYVDTLGVQAMKAGQDDDEIRKYGVFLSVDTMQLKAGNSYTTRSMDTFQKLAGICGTLCI